MPLILSLLTAFAVQLFSKDRKILFAFVTALNFLQISAFSAVLEAFVCTTVTVNSTEGEYSGTYLDAYPDIMCEADSGPWAGNYKLKISIFKAITTIHQLTERFQFLISGANFDSSFIVRLFFQFAGMASVAGILLVFYFFFPFAYLASLTTAQYKTWSADLGDSRSHWRQFIYADSNPRSQWLSFIRNMRRIAAVCLSFFASKYQIILYSILIKI